MLIYGITPDFFGNHKITFKFFIRNLEYHNAFGSKDAFKPSGIDLIHLFMSYGRNKHIGNIFLRAIKAIYIMNLISQTVKGFGHLCGTLSAPHIIIRDGCKYNDSGHFLFYH